MQDVRPKPWKKPPRKIDGGNEEIHVLNSKLRSRLQRCNLDLPFIFNQKTIKIVR